MYNFIIFAVPSHPVVFVNSISIALPLINLLHITEVFDLQNVCCGKDDSPPCIIS